MHIDIPDHLSRRLEQLAQGTGQDMNALVCEAIEQRLTRDERQQPPQETSAWQPFTDQDPLLSLIGFCEDVASVYD
jgi:predicted transcriptional regulator